MAGFERTKQVAQEAGDSELEGAASFRIAQQWTHLQDYRRAREAVQKAYGIADALSSKELKMQTMRADGNIKGRFGDLREEERILRAALTIAEELEDTFSIGVTRQNIAVALRRQGRRDEAEAVLGDATDAWALLLRSNSAWSSGRISEAIDLGMRCAELAEEQDLAQPLRAVMGNLINLHNFTK